MWRGRVVEEDVRSVSVGGVACEVLAWCVCMRVRLVELSGASERA